MSTSKHLEDLQKVFAETAGDSVSEIGILAKNFHLLRRKNVYHYTDIAGFISIMQKRELWASHIAFMNDKTEYLHGKEIFKNRIKQKLATVSDPEKQVLQDVLENLNTEISAGFFPTSSKDVFSISFCYNRDSLEMWRGYGKESGVAIGFDFSKCHSLPGMCLIREEMYKKLLNKYNNNPENVKPDYERSFSPISVLYNDDEKQALADQAIEATLNSFKNQASISEDAAILTASEFLSDVIFAMSPQFKHQGFSGESECRFVDNYVKKTDDAFRVHYRNRGGIILPYVKYKLMDSNCRPLQQMPICEIVIGPGLKQSKTVESIKYFLEKNDMGYLTENVHASDIPYVGT